MGDKGLFFDSFTNDPLNSPVCKFQSKVILNQFLNNILAVYSAYIQFTPMYIISKFALTNEGEENCETCVEFVIVFAKTCVDLTVLSHTNIYVKLTNNQDY